jgi:RNase P subunit RPR2
METKNPIKRFLQWTAKWEKIGIDNFCKIPTDFSDKENKIHCKYCGSLLPIFKFIVLSRCKYGETFIIKCRHCGKENKIKRW